MLLKSMVLWMLMHTLLSSVNNICRNTKIVETQNFASLFCLLDILEYLECFAILVGGWGGNCSWFGNYSCSSSTSSSRFYRCFSILVILVINSRGLGFFLILWLVDARAVRPYGEIVEMYG